MIIREATLSEMEILMEFQVQMAIETENVALDKQILRAGLTELFRDPRKGKYYVAESEGKLAGCLMTTFEWSEWRNGNVLWIQSVYVAQPFRGQGVYKKMYGHMQEMVSENAGLRGIRLYADKSNHDAMKVYRKLGMNGDHYQVFEWMKS